jgi:hypothetical protein
MVAQQTFMLNNKIVRKGEKVASNKFKKEELIKLQQAGLIADKQPKPEIVTDGLNPKLDKPTANKPVEENKPKPAANKPAANKPKPAAANKPTANKPAANKPAANKPAANKPK